MDRKTEPAALGGGERTAGSQTTEQLQNSKLYGLNQSSPDALARKFFLDMERMFCGNDLEEENRRLSRELRELRNRLVDIEKISRGY
jgi:hypothetical protein